MKHRLSEREIPEALKALGDEVAAKLPEPYDLIAEWAKYVPLEILLNLYFGCIAMYRDNDDGTIRMTWSAAGLQDYVVPIDLHRRTYHYMDSTKALRPPTRALAESTIFVDENGPITEPTFLKKLKDRFQRD